MKKLIILLAFILPLDSRAEYWSVPKAYIEYAKRYDLDPRDVYAIALRESGKNVDGVYMPWPWTLNLAGKSKRYDSQSEMLQGLDSYLNAGLRNIDIGPMQINYMYNESKIKKYGIKRIVNPYHNIEFACMLLRERLKLFNYDRDRAIASYFNFDSEKSKGYLAGVKKIRMKLVVN